MAEPITIILLTYQRTDYAVKTIESACRYLTYPDLRWYIADDGSDPEHVRRLERALDESGAHLIGTYSKRHSYGASANTGITAASYQGNLMLFLEDDWELTRPVDLWAYASLLMEDESVGMVRMGYLNNGISGTLMGHRGRLYWQLDDTKGRMHSAYAFAGHPSLRHSRFHNMWGLYPEGLQPGETEIGMANLWHSTTTGPHIVWPVEMSQWGPWGHIGAIQSYEWTGGREVDLPATVSEGA